MESIIITLCVISFTAVVMSPFVINKIIKFKLEIERMRLDAEVKKEEIRAKNQFQMDKLMAEENKDYKKDLSGIDSHNEEYGEPIDVKTNKERLRY